MPADPYEAVLARLADANLRLEAEPRWRRRHARRGSAVNIAAAVAAVAAPISMVGTESATPVVVVVIAVVGALGYHGAQASRQQRAGERHRALAQRLVEASERGEDAEWAALEREIDAWTASARTGPERALAFELRARVAAVRGQPALARCLWATLLKSGWSGSKTFEPLETDALYELVVASLAVGALDDASVLLEAGEARSGPVGAIVLRGLLEVRRGREAAAIREIEGRLPEAERTCPASFTKAARVIWAFALERGSGDPYRAEARSAEAEALLAGVPPVDPGDLAWLGEGFPELATYLEAKGLA